MKQKDSDDKTSGRTAEEWFKRGYDSTVPEITRECYEKALSLAPGNPGLWEIMGLVWSDTEEFKESLTCLSRVSGPLSNHPDHLCNLGYAHFRLKKYEDALDCYKRAIKQENQHRRAWELSGELLFETGREDDAFECFRKAKKFPQPDNNFIGELYADIIAGFEKDCNPPLVISENSLNSIDDFRIFSGGDGTYWGEHEQMKEIVSLLSGALKGGLLEPPLYLFFNVRVANGEIDCLILLKHGPVILELKNYQGKITGLENGDWTVLTDSGSTARVTSNVFRQCNKHRFDFYTKYEKIARDAFPAIIEHTGRGSYSNLILIQSWGYFRRGSRYDQSQIAGDKVRSWFSVITGDDLVERLKYVNAGYTLLRADMDAMSRGLGLKELSPEEYGWFGIRKEKGSSPVPPESALSRDPATIATAERSLLSNPVEESLSRGTKRDDGSAVALSYTCESAVTPGGVRGSGADYDSLSATKEAKVLPSLQNPQSWGSAYYCSNLILTYLESNDLKNAYKYVGDLVRYSPEDIKEEVINLHAQLGCRLEGGLSDVPGELLVKADLIRHKIIVSEY